MGATSIFAVPKPALLFVRCRIPKCKQGSCFLLKANSWNCEYLFVTGTSHSPSLPWLLLPLLFQAAAAAEDLVPKELKWSLGQVWRRLPPLPSLQPFQLLVLSPFQIKLSSLGRTRSWKCLFWGNVLLMLLSGRLSSTENWQKVNKITFLSPLRTCCSWELFLSQALALYPWLICSKVT